MQRMVWAMTNKRDDTPALQEAVDQVAAHTDAAYLATSAGVGVRAAATVEQFAQAMQAIARAADATRGSVLQLAWRMDLQSIDAIDWPFPTWRVIERPFDHEVDL